MPQSVTVYVVIYRTGCKLLVYFLDIYCWILTITRRETRISPGLGQFDQDNKCCKGFLFWVFIKKGGDEGIFPNKIFVKKNLGLKKMLYPTKFWNQQNCGSKKISGPEQNSESEKKFGAKKNFRLKKIQGTNKYSVMDPSDP